MVGRRARSAGASTFATLNGAHDEGAEGGASISERLVARWEKPPVGFCYLDLPVLWIGGISPWAQFGQMVTRLVFEARG